MSPQYECILVSRPDSGVVLITLNRPKVLNALSSPLAFAAGGDIKEMKDADFSSMYRNNFLDNWSFLSKLHKPVIAAVSGLALGGGCELALMCDIILVSPTAKFGQPEINLGIIPGGGGSQRLAHAVGKSRAMEMVLTGRLVSAEEAERWGMVSRIVTEAEGGVVKEAVTVAQGIASKGQLAVQAGKEAVNAAFEMTLSEGLRFERRTCHGLFATKDQKEGMTAFIEKRPPQWLNA